MEHGELEAGLVIPDGFAAALRGTGTAELRYLGTTGALAQGLRAPIDAAAARISAIAIAARVAEAEGLAGWDQARAAAEAGYGSVPGVAVSVSRIGEPGSFAGFTQFTFGASTQLVMFMFLTSMTASLRLVLTRKLGVSRRMVSTPTSPATIIAGEAIGRYGVAVFQAAYIVIVSALLFGVSWGDPVAAAAIILVFALVCAGAAMLLGAVAGTADQAASLGVFLGLALGALGGCMIPLQIMPATDAVDRAPDPPVVGADRAAVADRGRRRDRVGRDQPRRAGRLRGRAAEPRQLAAAQGDRRLGRPGRWTTPCRPNMLYVALTIYVP